MATKYRVVQVKGAQPESFIVVGIDFGEHAIKSTSASMSEVELRKHLQDAGATADDVNSWIEQAKDYPG